MKRSIRAFENLKVDIGNHKSEIERIAEVRQSLKVSFNKQKYMLQKCMTRKIYEKSDEEPDTLSSL